MWKSCPNLECAMDIKSVGKAGGRLDTDGMTLGSYWTHIQNMWQAEDVLVFEMSMKDLNPRYCELFQSDVWAPKQGVQLSFVHRNKRKVTILYGANKVMDWLTALDLGALKNPCWIELVHVALINVKRMAFMMSSNACSTPPLLPPPWPVEYREALLLF